MKRFISYCSIDHVAHKERDGKAQAKGDEKKAPNGMGYAKQ